MLRRCCCTFSRIIVCDDCAVLEAFAITDDVRNLTVDDTTCTVDSQSLDKRSSFKSSRRPDHFDPRTKRLTYWRCSVTLETQKLGQRHRSLCSAQSRICIAQHGWPRPCVTISSLSIKRMVDTLLQSIMREFHAAILRPDKMPLHMDESNERKSQGGEEKVRRDRRGFVLIGNVTCCAYKASCRDIAPMRNFGCLAQMASC